MQLFKPVSSEPVSGVPDMFHLRNCFDPQQVFDLTQLVVDRSPFRHMQTPRGYTMAAAITNCGVVGWVSDRRGYRYEPIDPETGTAWPEMPPLLFSLAQMAAQRCGFDDFAPDACLINRYAPGKGMSAHQDRDENDFTQPIVSLSLGLPARFFVQGSDGKGRSTPIDLASGDVVVWGGASRLFYHGVRPLKPGIDPVTGSCRINLTFRKAG